MTKWLSKSEQDSWRAWLDASRLLRAELNRELMAAHGLSDADYEVLVQLSENPEHRIRMSELADRTLSSRSRLSHQIDRLEKSGLIRREWCADDARGTWAVLTPIGWEKIVAAAPDHVDGVRRHLVDLLSAEDFTKIGEICRLIVHHLDSEGQHSNPQG